MNKSKILVLIIFFPITLIDFICGIPYFLITSEKIKNIQKLKQTIKFWKRKLNMAHLKIMCEINPKAELSNADVIIPYKKYKIIIKPSHFSKEIEVLHELLHIKRGDCDCQPNNIFLLTLLNLYYDIIVNISIIPIWLKNKNIN